jgi:hypothetical protein
MWVASLFLVRSCFFIWVVSSVLIFCAARCTSSRVMFPSLSDIYRVRFFSAVLDAGKVTRNDTVQSCKKKLLLSRTAVPPSPEIKKKTRKTKDPATCEVVKTSGLER